MGLLRALKTYHAEVAAEALGAISRTGDLDVANMAKTILEDQIESILTAQKMPELMAMERSMFEGRLGFEPMTVPPKTP